MRTLFILVFKEFRQIFRNRSMVPIMFMLPIIQLLILAYAADFEVKNLKLAVVNADGSEAARQLTGKFSASDYFRVVPVAAGMEEASHLMEADKADLILMIPAGFEADLARRGTADLGLTANAIDGVKGGLGTNYAQAVIRQFYQDWQARHRISPPPPPPAQVSITQSGWFNPRMDYKTFMVPGILGMLVTMIGMFLTSMNIAREKEIGTIEQLNVTPIRKYQFILGKLIPFWVIALLELTIGLVAGVLLYDIPVVGSVAVLYGYTAIYMFAVLGIGLLISTTADTQQQAMFIAWFFMVIFIFLSGFFTALENMPDWARWLTYLNPVRYFMEVVRMVLLKGSGWADIAFQVQATALFAVAINVIAIARYRKTSA